MDVSPGTVLDNDIMRGEFVTNSVASLVDVKAIFDAYRTIHLSIS